MGKKAPENSTGEISNESLSELFEFIPAKVVQFRVFALDHENEALLAQVAELTPEGRSARREDEC